MSQIAPAAHAGFAAASAYDAHRPSYPDTAVNNLLQHLGVLGLKRARIVDLAAGTGKFTELLAERPEGYEIVAVEPHAEMRGVLEGKVREKGWKNVRVVEGTAKDMGAVEGDWADAVIVAQVRTFL
jgi:ubiquinone/menaquinone biosynthesis C-methylase UbiE